MSHFYWIKNRHTEHPKSQKARLSQSFHACTHDPWSLIITRLGWIFKFSIRSYSVSSFDVFHEWPNKLCRQNTCNFLAYVCLRGSTQYACTCVVSPSNVSHHIIQSRLLVLQECIPGDCVLLEWFLKDALHTLMSARNSTHKCGRAECLAARICGKMWQRLHFRRGHECVQRIFKKSETALNVCNYNKNIKVSMLTRSYVSCFIWLIECLKKFVAPF